jgi:hypothetical protein
MAKPAVWVFLGDMHTDGKTGLSPTPINAMQTWLLARWNETVKEILKIAKGLELHLKLGGDLVDNPGLDARTHAFELLRPLVNRADKNIHGVPGTPYHVGADGEEDRSIYQMCGAKCKQVWDWEEGGRRYLWAHHMVKIGNTAWTELNGMKQTAETTYHRAIQDEEKTPALIVGHHVHRVPRGTPIVWRGITVAVTPCWQLPNDFASKVAAGIMPTIGAMLYYPAEHRVQYLTHKIPANVRSM